MATQPQTSTANTPRRRRLRFSIRGLILVSALFCAVLSHVLTSLELSRVRKEVRSLRDELGYLTIEDTGKLHAIAIASDEAQPSKRWRWKLYVPAGRKFRVCYKFTDLPVSGFPDDQYHFFEDIRGKPIYGELSLSTSLVRDPTGAWRFVIDPKFVGDQFSQTRTQPIENADWLEAEPVTSSQIAGSETTESVSPGESMVLLKFWPRKLGAGGRGVAVDSEPTDGIMVWIQEQ